MATWTEFAATRPELAAVGRSQIYQWEIGLGFLATVRADGAPRVHPVCPVISSQGLHILVVAGPKQQDLLRDGRYSLHSETFAPPRHDDGFAVSGRARPVTDPDARRRFDEHLRSERKDFVPWPTYDRDRLFELTIDRCLLMLTEPDGPFPAGPTVWREGSD
jgi:hypothetical protein